MRKFSPNRRFKKEYNRLFRRDPLAANTFLLLCEMADERGQVKTTPAELAILIALRFQDPEARQL